MKRICILTASVIICGILSGCKSFLPSRAELEDFDPVQVVGVDKCTEDPSLMEVTLIGQTKKGGGTDGGRNVINIVSDKGYTAFEAECKVKARSLKRFFFGYADYFLIGEEAAKEDLHKYIDFTLRDHEIRLSPKVYIVREGSAKELLNTTSSEDRFILDKLDSFKAAPDYVSDSNEVELIDIANMLEDSSVVIPAIKCEEFNDKKLIGKMPEKDICLCGYAVFKNTGFIGYIDKEISRGYNFLTNEVGSCPVNVTDESGKPVALEVIKADTKIRAKFNGDSLEEVTFHTHVTANIDEQHSLDDNYKQSVLKKLESQLSEIIKYDMERVVAYSKENKVECIKLKKRVEAAHAYKWRKIKDDWDSLYPELSIKVEVESHIVRGYDIQKPSGDKEGKE